MEDKFQAAIAKTIKKIRLDMNVSQEELAFRAELDRTYVSGVERQKRNPTIKSLSRIIIALNISEQEFLLQVIDELNIN